MITTISKLSCRGRLVLPPLVASVVLLCSAVSADVLEPGSLLVYPEFDNRAGVQTVLTITNVSRNLGQGEVNVHFKYIGAKDNQGNDLGCRQTNIIETLTPMDTLTLITNYHNPRLEVGYVYAYAEDPDTGQPINHNYLVGSLLIVDGLDLFRYSVNPFSFEAVAGGATTDLDSDRELDLNGLEYALAPDEIIIPRFLGQSPIYNSTLTLISLTGAGESLTVVNFEIANDNEELFTTNFLFDCWTQVNLLDISGVFDQDYLANLTSHDPDEILGASYIESGWMRIDGRATITGSYSQRNPAVLAVLVESIGTRGVADQPFTIGTQSNGSLHAW